MSFYGIATAITGERTNPRFHCNVLKLDSKQTQKKFPRHINQTPFENDYKQVRLIKEAVFKTVSRLSFTDSFQANDPSDIKRVAKRFLNTVAQTIALQKRSTINPNAKIPIIIGQDGRKGMDYYSREELRKAFTISDPQKISKLLPDCQFHLGSFSEFDLANPAIPRNTQDETSRSQWLVKAKAILDTAQGQDRETILEELKEYARDHAGRQMHRFAATNMRFFGLSSNDDKEFDFNYLNWDPEIERAFIDAIRLFYLVIYPKDQRKKATETLYHMHMKIDDKRQEPFIDVIKTYLLDLLAESEDGKNRISNAENRTIQRELRKYCNTQTNQPARSRAATPPLQPSQAQ